MEPGKGRKSGGIARTLPRIGAGDHGLGDMPALPAPWRYVSLAGAILKREKIPAL
jgi:hypothetical protein